MCAGSAGPAGPGRSRRVAVVTDSTSMLPTDTAAAHDVAVVPLQVVVGVRSFDEGGSGDPRIVADALRASKPVSTSRPAPQAFLAAYEEAARAGADAVVSVHLSAEISGTFESARLAAREAPIPVEVVDSRLVGLGTGFAVLAAVDALDAGGDAAAGAEAARARAAATTCLFYVDTLEHLRRGGRIGAAAKLVGTALAMKPLLSLDDGTVVPLEKVRTTARALSRLTELAVAAAADHRVDVAVAHLSNPDRAATVARQLRARVAGMQDLVVGEVGAVIGAHVGPGMVAVVVAPRL